MRAIGISALLALLLGALASPASALSLVYTWSGTITSVDPAIAAESPPFAVGDPFSASAVIDASTTGLTTSNPDQLNYTPVTSVSLILNGTYTIQGSPFSSSLSVVHGSSGPDEFRATGSGLFGAPDLGVWHTSTFQLFLSSGTGSVLANNALPTSLDINDWQLTSMNVTFADLTTMASPVAVRGTISGVGVTVPEPGPLALLVSGLAGLAVAGRRRAVQAAS